MGTLVLFDAGLMRDVERDLSLDKDVDRDKGKSLCCAHCKQRVTSASSAVEIEGMHTHRRRNPYGHQFIFQCYAGAPGCEVSGEPTSDYSWFVGYRWQYASCRQCQRHLGWFFRGENGFFGLIRDQLVPCDKSADKAG